MSQQVSASAVELSIIIPLYNEEENISLLQQMLVPVLQQVSESWEIICINDGSRDETALRLKNWAQADTRVKLISLSRNFGKEAALSAGIDKASGRAVIPFDADLQDPPELIGQMVEQWRKGHKVVLAVRKDRLAEHWLKRTTALWFYRLLAKVTSIPMPINAGDFRLMDAQVIEILRMLPERTRYMKGLFAWVGFEPVNIYYERKARAGGTPKQSWLKLWGLAKDGMFSFTTLPLKLTTYLGILISTLAIAYGVWLLLRTILLGVDVPGYASIMAGVLFMGGLQMICLGIIGEYIGRIYREVKQRPLYVIEHESGFSQD